MPSKPCFPLFLCLSAQDTNFQGSVHELGAEPLPSIITQSGVSTPKGSERVCMTQTTILGSPKHHYHYQLHARPNALNQSPELQWGPGLPSGLIGLGCKPPLNQSCWWLWTQPGCFTWELTHQPKKVLLKASDEISPLINAISTIKTGSC